MENFFGEHAVGRPKMEIWAKDVLASFSLLSLWPPFSSILLLLLFNLLFVRQNRLENRTTDRAIETEFEPTV